MNNDKLIIGGHEFNSRFILGSGKYSLKLIESAVKDAGAEIITLAVRRANTKEQENILDYIPEKVTLQSDPCHQVQAASLLQAQQEDHVYPIRPFLEPYSPSLFCILESYP